MSLNCHEYFNIHTYQCPLIGSWHVLPSGILTCLSTNDKIINVFGENMLLCTKAIVITG